MSDYCGICNNEVSLNQSIKGNKICSRCASAARRLAVKLVAIQYLGGKCERCGAIKHPAFYEFHHRDPSEKEFGIGLANGISWDRLKKELDKCELLCNDCHTLEHTGKYNSVEIIKHAVNSTLMKDQDAYLDWIEEDIKPEILDILKKNRDKSIIDKECEVCNKSFKADKSAKYCSPKCSAIGQRKVDRPTEEQLKLDMESLPWTGIGKKYGISDNAARNWARSYGLID